LGQRIQAISPLLRPSCSRRCHELQHKSDHRRPELSIKASERTRPAPSLRT
jgi:hypothetical protein